MAAEERAVRSFPPRARLPRPFRRVLDPADRASEMLFGLIMVLTFTSAMSVAGTAQDDVRAMLVGAIGCNTAWGIIDAMMYLLGAHGARSLGAGTIEAVRSAPDEQAAHALIADSLPPILVPALTAADLERLRAHLLGLAPSAMRPRLTAQDWLGAGGVFVIVSLGIVPVLLPFVLIGDVALALWISHAVAIALLFVTGFGFGRPAGRPWQTGLAMVAIGIALVAVANALGG